MHPFHQPMPAVREYLTNKVSDLLGFCKTSTSGIADRPTSFFFSFELAMLKQVNKRRNEIRVDDRLDLIAIAGCDVRYRPASFFSDSLL